MDFINTLKFFGIIAIFTFFLTVLLIMVAQNIFPKIGLMDRPHKYGYKRKPIPYYGGLIIFISFLISVIVFVPMGRDVYGVLAGAFLIVAVGFLDDLVGVKPIIRLFVQALAAFLLVVAGIGLLSFKIPFIGVLELNQILFDFEFFGHVFNISVLSGIFVLGWVMLLINSINFLDGVPGLTSGVSGIAAFAIFLLSIHPGIHEDPSSQFGVATLALIVSMLGFAFAFFDFPKPSILMGDSGSTFFGFMLAVLAVFSGGKVATAFLVLGIPVLDLGWVVVRRTLEGRKFWHGDLMHMHHRFLYYGLSKRQTVLAYYLIALVFGATSVMFVDTQQKIFIIISLFVLMVLLAMMVVLGDKRKKSTK